VLEGTLIRKITRDYFDVDAIASHAKLNMVSGEEGFSFNICQAITSTLTGGMAR
jgi:acetoacetyl-[acyl-carrier protein] synthase